jgi:ribose-phosphate pyrophosphokinase
MLEAVGVQHCVFIDVHNLAAEQNAFWVPIDVLETKNLHAQWCAERLKSSKKVRVVSPDSGGVPRCTRFRNALAKLLGEAHEDNIEICVYDKVRDGKTGRVTGGRIIGDVEDADAIIYDDLISTATTMGKAYEAVVQSNGNVLCLAAAHGVCCGRVNEVFDKISCPIILGDTIEPYRLNATNLAKVELLDTSRMMAEAITRIHRGTGSISELLG